MLVEMTDILPPFLVLARHVILYDFPRDRTPGGVGLPEVPPERKTAPMYIMFLSCLYSVR